MAESGMQASLYNWVSGDTLINDRTGARATLSEEQRRWLDDADGAPADWLAQIVADGFLVAAETAETRQFSMRHVDIETLSHCNARCLFCPQSEAPKPKEAMPMDLFRQVVRQVAGHTPEWVALNNFSEPLLDPHFLERCAVLREHRLRLALFTNGTVLKAETSQALAGMDVLHSVIFNFPSLEAAEWAELMHLPASMHARTLRQIEALVEAWSGPVSLIVNAIGTTHERRAQELTAHFAPHAHVTVHQYGSNTLAGNIDNEWVGASTLVETPRLKGCDRAVSHVHVGVNGDVFLCCLDYHRKHVFGNAAREPLTEILSGDQAADLRAQIYGLKDASPELLCRTCCHIRR